MCQVCLMLPGLGLEPQSTMLQGSDVTIMPHAGSYPYILRCVLPDSEDAHRNQEAERCCNASCPSPVQESGLAGRSDWALCSLFSLIQGQAQAPKLHLVFLSLSFLFQNNFLAYFYL